MNKTKKRKRNSKSVTDKYDIIHGNKKCLFIDLKKSTILLPPRERGRRRDYVYNAQVGVWK